MYKESKSTCHLRMMCVCKRDIETAIMMNKFDRNYELSSHNGKKQTMKYDYY